MSHFVTYPEPPKIRHTYRTPRFLVGLAHTCKPWTKAHVQISLNCLRRFLSRGCCKRVFCLKGFVLGGFVRSPSIRLRVHLLQQKVKHHLKFQVSYTCMTNKFIMV